MRRDHFFRALREHNDALRPRNASHVLDGYFRYLQSRYRAYSPREDSHWDFLLPAFDFLLRTLDAEETVSLHCGSFLRVVMPELPDKCALPLTLASESSGYEIGIKIVPDAPAKSAVSILGPGVDADRQLAFLNSFTTGTLVGAACNADVPKFISATKIAGRNAEYLNVISEGRNDSVHFLIGAS